MNGRRAISLGDKWVGDGHGLFIVIEAGPTHDGLETALCLVDAAADAGADAIKFQILDVDRLMASETVPFTYRIIIDRETGATEEVTEPLDVILRRREMPRDHWEKVKAHCDERGLLMFCTAMFPETVAWLVDLGVTSIKIASGDITHIPFIRYVGGTGVCVQLDTGAATLGEVERAVDAILEEGNDRVIVHHCPSGYPARLESINLNIIPTLRRMFDFPIAFSDHTPGWDMDAAAVALGANLVEKTITLDKTTRSCEHMFSLEPHEVRTFVESMRAVEAALGTRRRVMGPEERAKKTAARRSIVLIKAMEEGEPIEEGHIDFKRPGSGISPTFLQEVTGRRVAHSLSAGTILTWQDLM